MKKIISFVLLAIFVVTLAACDGSSPEELDDILNCITDPDADGCEDVIPDINDERTSKEILADLVIENWDGNINNVFNLLDEINVSSSKEVETEFSFGILEADQVQYIHVVMIDNTIETEDEMLIHRTVKIDLDGEELLLEMIFQEVFEGSNVYLNLVPLKEMFIEQGNEDSIELLDMIGATEDWLMFKHEDMMSDDSEFGNLKDLIVSTLYDQLGESFFSDLQTNLDLELDISDLSDYGINLEELFTYLMEEDFMNAQMMLDEIDFESMIDDLDNTYLVPEIVTLLLDNKTELDELEFDTDNQILSLQELGTMLWLDSLTEDEIVSLTDILVDNQTMEDNLDLSELLTHYYDGSLDHYLVMSFLENEEVIYELSMIPGFDVDAFTNLMDNLDYDALYLETLDFEELTQAIYDGEEAFDLYLTNLSSSAPLTASILEAFSGLVLELEGYMTTINDIDYALNNLYMFDDYFTMDYYLDNDLLTMNVEKTEDFSILTTVKLEPMAYAFILQDFIKTSVEYLEGIESFELPQIQGINCFVGETCIPMSEYDESLPDFQDIMTKLGLLGEIKYTVFYNPSLPSEVVTELNLTDFVNKLVMMDGTVTQEPVVDLSYKVTVREGQEITIPQNTSDLNVIGKDIAKFSLSILAFEALESIENYYMENEDAVALELGETRALSTFEGNLNLSMAFDLDMSFVEMSESGLEPDYLIELYWNDGSKVFTSPIGLVELNQVFGPDSVVATNEVFLQYVNRVNEENFSMTKLLLVLFFDQTDTYIEEPIVMPTK